MEDVPNREQLFVLKDANARTGRREKGGVGSKDNKILGVYGRYTLNDCGELLMSFANNHDLKLVSTLFCTLMGGVSHIFNGRCKKRIDYILTRHVIANSYGMLMCTPSPPSFLFRTTTLCPLPSSSSAISLETAV